MRGEEIAIEGSAFVSVGFLKDEALNPQRKERQRQRERELFLCTEREIYIIEYIYYIYYIERHLLDKDISHALHT